MAQRAWTTTWGASPEPLDAGGRSPLLTLDDQTVRERVRISIGGSRIRIRLSNEHGSSPLVVGAATVPRPRDAAGIEPGSARSITFSGHKSTTIPAGAPLLSDELA